MLQFAFITLLAASPPQIPPDAAHLGGLAAQVAADFDPTRQAFVTKEGAVGLASLELALRLASRQAAEGSKWRERAVQTLQWSTTLYDSVGGGFVHGLNDKDPQRPIFRKYLADNAELLESEAHAYWLTGDETHRRNAQRTADYLDRVLIDPRGEFHSAQSGGSEFSAEASGRGARAYLTYYRLSGKENYRRFALHALDHAWENAWDPAAGFVHPAQVGKATAGLLADAVFMGEALLEAYRVADRDHDLAHARMLGDFLLARLRDEKRGAFLSSATPVKGKGYSRGKGGRDSETNAEAVRFLMDLSRSSGEKRYTQDARTTLQYFLPRLSKDAEEVAAWALALDEFLAPPPDRPPAPRPVPRAEERPQPRSKRYR